MIKNDDLSLIRDSSIRDFAYERQLREIRSVFIQPGPKAHVPARPIIIRAFRIITLGQDQCIYRNSSTLPRVAGVTMVLEKTIRELLVTRLDLLEPGLVHIETEHKLPNMHGSKGSIDILARDALGHRVIIELKRSNDSARSAIHELCKYAALFQTEHGLPSYRLRCFVVSTQWHELLIPFGEFARSSDFQVEGFDLSISPSGTPLSAKKVAVPNAPEPVEFFLHHDILLYETAERRDAAAMGVADQPIKSGAISAFVCKLNSSESLDQQPYRYALYSVVGGIQPAVRAKIESELKAEYETNDLESINPTMVQEEFSRRLLEQPAWVYDTYEIGYPDKLATILRTGWSCVEILRRGRMMSASSASDDELLASLQGLTGDNTIMYQRVATPRILRSWIDFINASEKCLCGNPEWERAFQLFGQQLELRQPDSLVSAKIYNPLQIPISLHKLIFEKDPRYLPTMEVVSSKDCADTLVLVGFLAWSGRAAVTSVQELLSGIVGSIVDYMTMRHLDCAWELDEVLTSRLGLDYETLVLKPKPGGSYDTFKLVEGAEGVSLVPYTAMAEDSLVRYLIQHRSLVTELVDELDKVSRFA